MAASFLQQNGFSIITRNFKCRNGEIDIIAKKDNVVVFVEVKARQNSDFGYPLEFVDKRKQLRIISCAKYFLMKNKQFDEYNIRFDVIGIENDNIEVVENAFWED